MKTSAVQRSRPESADLLTLTGRRPSPSNPLMQSILVLVHLLIFSQCSRRGVPRGSCARQPQEDAVTTTCNAGVCEIKTTAIQADLSFLLNLLHTTIKRISDRAAEVSCHRLLWLRSVTLAFGWSAAPGLGTS